MKIRRFLPVFTIFCALALFTLFGCENPWMRDILGIYKEVKHTVTFNNAGGSTVDSQKVIEGETAEDPGTPETAPSSIFSEGLYADSVVGSAFIGWFLGGLPYDFDTPVTENITLTAQWTTPGAIDVFEQAGNNIVEKAVAYVKANASAGGYTLYLENNYSAGTQTINISNARLSIIGLTSERTIQYSGANSSALFNISASGASLTLGENITLCGIAGGTINLVNVSSSTLIMKAGSKITGHSSTNSNGVVYITGANARFEMQGGEISGNNSSYSINANGTAGLYINSDASQAIVISGGLISGNFRESKSADVYLVTTMSTSAPIILSGTAHIGSLILRNNASDYPNLAIGANWSGSVAMLNLYGSQSDVALTITAWNGKQIVTGSSGHTLTLNDINNITMGEFSDTGTDTQSIAATHAIVNSGANIGKLAALGSADYPFAVTNALELSYVGKGAANPEPYKGWTLGASYRQTANIDLSGITWTPIGQSPAFTGTYDGGGYTISNLTTINDSIIGLFGGIEGLAALVKNIRLVNVNVSGVDVVGGLAGYVDGGTIQNCSVSGMVTGTVDTVGGVMGANHAGTVENCSFTGSVSGPVYIGGVAGGNYSGGIITNSYSTGNVSSTDSYVGGVVGNNAGTVKNCFTTGSVEGGSWVGGVVGYSNGTVNNCYSTGNISGDFPIGGVVGYNFGKIKDCYATGSISGNDEVGGVVGYNGGEVESCVALNPSVTRSSGTYITAFGRVAGLDEDTMTNNYARSGMTLFPDTSTTATKAADRKDGADITETQWALQTWWSNAANGPGFVFGSAGEWDWNSTTGLPILRNMPAGTQNPVVQP